MKKIFLISVFIFACCVVAIAQVNTAKKTYVLSAVQYMQKSKKQSTIALTTSIPGCLLLIMGGIMSLSEFGNGLPGGTGYNETNARTGDALMIAGSGLVLIAIPFQHAARKNKKLAIAMAIKTEPLQQLQKNSFIKKSAPSLALKINL